MAEDKEKLSDEITDNEEYERALEVLNKSKGERVKKIVAEKKAKKQKEKEASEKASGNNKNNSGKTTFIDKCKKDPIIPACILCIVIAIVLAVVKFVVPMFSVKTLGITIDDYRTQYQTTGLYNSVLMPYNFAIPEVTYQESSNVSLTAAGEAQNKQNDKYIYFYAAIPNTATNFSTAIQGSALKSNGEIVALRVMASLDADNYSDPNYINFIYIFFGSYLQTFMPDVSDHDVQLLISHAVENMGTNEFTVRQDVAYRVSIITGDVNYLAFDIMPTANLDK